MVFFLNQNGTCTRQDTDHIYQGSNNASKVIAITSVSPIQTFVQVAFTLPNSLTYGYLPIAYKGAYQVGGDTDNQMYLYELDLPYNITEAQGEVGVSFNVVNSVTGANTTSYTNTFTVEYSALPIPPASASESELEQILNLLNAYYAQNTGIITTHTEQIQQIQTEQAQQNEEIEKLKEASVIGETPVGTLPSSATMPTDTEIQAYYAQNVGREPRAGDVFFFTQTLPSGYKVYKYIYGATGWAYYEIPGANVGSNPNLVINSNFAINQRGLTRYTVQGYSADRWGLLKDGDAYFDVSTKTLIGGTTGTYSILQQKLELNPTDFSGQYLTLSLNKLLLKGRCYISIGYYRGNTFSDIKTVYTSQTDSNFAMLSETVKMPTNLAVSDVLVVRVYTQAGGEIQLDWVKLELGEVPTAFTPPNPGEELQKCLYYFRRIRNEYENTYQTIATCIAETNNSFRFVVEGKMRVTPTLTYHGNFGVVSSSNSNNIVTNISRINMSTIGTVVSVTITTSVTKGEAGLFQISNDTTAYIDLDAEI